jgi:hypothetical protein
MGQAEAPLEQLLELGDHLLPGLALLSEALPLLMGHLHDVQQQGGLKSHVVTTAPSASR